MSAYAPIADMAHLALAARCHNATSASCSMMLSARGNKGLQAPPACIRKLNAVIG
jgi:hypothetical protein